MTLFSVKNKVCCVTGAGRGIGYELSTALKKNGAFVVGIDLKYPRKNYVIDKKLVFVATDNIKIVNVCKKFGIQATMTSTKCKTGTDRMYDFSKKIIPFSMIFTNNRIYLKSTR